MLMEAASLDGTLARLTGEGRISTADADRAVAAARDTGQPIRMVLDRLGLVSQKDWASTAAAVAGLDLIGASDMPCPLPAVGRLSPEFLQRKGIAPLDPTAARPAFALADPDDAEAMRALRMAFGSELDLFVATDRDIAAARAASLEAELPDGAAELDDAALRELANNAPTITFIESLFAQAVERRATDIHLETQERGLRVRCRIDGMLTEAAAPAPVLVGGVLSRIKILAGMDISERRLPQDGRIRQRVGGRTVDMRVASLPSTTGETLVLRLLDGSAGLNRLSDLELPGDIERAFRRAATQPDGLILVTGPTGSGKTTTLHALLAELNETGRKVVTIENPVEITAPGAVQVEVRPEIGLSFAAVLRTVLRHDPDILMVGEIRDPETAELAVRAAMTGHLVLSTLHTNSAAEAVQRMTDLGVPRYLLDPVLRMTAAQRLVRRLCECAGHVRPEARDPRLARMMARLRPELGASEWRLRSPKGCERCRGTGYRGRRAVFEALDETAIADGTEPRPMSAAAIDLVIAGETSLQEVARVFGARAFGSN